VEHSRLKIDGSNADSVGVIIGSGIGGIRTWEKEHSALLTRGPSRVSAFFIPMMISNMASGNVAMALSARGPNFSIASACASAAHAIGSAFNIIRHGDAVAMVAGGSEASVTPLAVAGFSNMKALSTRNDTPQSACRPFDKDRDGFVIAEGAAAMILESLSSAEKRGADILCELVGFGMSADAHHITQPDPEGGGPRLAVEACLACAGMAPEEVDYINAHAPGTPAGDGMEAEVIQQVFCGSSNGPLVSSTKSMHGHLLGAAGGVELLATIQALREDVVPPTLSHTTPDPVCGRLDFVPGKAREHKVRVALSNSFGFGGQNAALLVREF